MKNSIILDKDHGVNPSLILCFWCGEPEKGIALLGNSIRVKKNKQARQPRSGIRPGSLSSSDFKAPRCMWDGDYTPCDKCLSKMKKGTVIIEITPGYIPTHLPDGIPAVINGNVWATGRYICVSNNASFLATFKEFLIKDFWPDVDVMFMEEETFTPFLNNIQNQPEAPTSEEC